MADRNEIEQIIRKVYKARQRDDVEETLAYFDPDARFRIAASPALGPISRSANGHEELRKMFQQLFPTWDFTNFNVDSIHVEGDTAFVYSSGKITHSPSGKIVETEILDRVKIRNGKIVDFLQFVDTHLVADLTRP